MRLNKELLQDGHHYVTTNFVLDETYTGLLTKVGHFAAVDFGEKIRASHTVQVIHVSEDMEEEAWRLFKSVKGWIETGLKIDEAKEWMLNVGSNEIKEWKKGDLVSKRIKVHEVRVFGSRARGREGIKIY